MVTKILNPCFTQTLQLKREYIMFHESISVLITDTLQMIQLHSWTLLGVLQISLSYDRWHGQCSRVRHDYNCFTGLQSPEMPDRI